LASSSETASAACRDRNAIVEALAEWQEQGVAHVICSPDPTDVAGVVLLCEGARQFRAA
jgi:hypothetical protein